MRRTRLPQTARANVNCRIFPGEDPQEVHKTLKRSWTIRKVKVSFVRAARRRRQANPVVPVPPSPLLPEVTQAMEKTSAASVWPGVPLVPTMSTGATDGKISAHRRDPHVRNCLHVFLI